MARAAKWMVGVLLWIVVALCLGAAILPAFLDRIYYRGPDSGHFDGARFSIPTATTLRACPAAAIARASSGAG